MEFSFSCGILLLDGLLVCRVHLLLLLLSFLCVQLLKDFKVVPLLVWLLQPRVKLRKLVMHHFLFGVQIGCFQQKFERVLNLPCAA